jgi:formamidopyrimidine-DNA glycosylase
LAPWLTGRTVVSASLVDAVPGPKYAGLERAVGQRVREVTRRGKFLLLPLQREGRESGDELVIHLGMTGVLSHRAPGAHLRVRLGLDGSEPSALYFSDVRRFGRFMVVRSDRYDGLPTLRALGPDALSPAFTPELLRAALARSGAPVKAALLSQRPVAGVGNIYADEVLWRARVHPLRPARRLTRHETIALHGAIHEVLTAAVEAQGTTLYDYRTVAGEVGAYRERLSVYDHAGEPCPRCGTPIVKLVVAQRGTHACPSCQRPPRRRG